MSIDEVLIDKSNMLLVTGYIHYKIKCHVYGIGRGRGLVVHALMYIKCVVLNLLFFAFIREQLSLVLRQADFIV